MAKIIRTGGCRCPPRQKGTKIVCFRGQDAKSKTKGRKTAAAGYGVWRNLRVVKGRYGKKTTKVSPKTCYCLYGKRTGRRRLRTKK